jgi:hypothetical protein
VFVRIVTLTVVAAWACVARPAAADESASEYAVKAAYLFNFARFVSWPHNAFATPGTALTICILGSDPFGSTLDSMLSNEVIDGHPLEARRITELAQADGCHILFVNAGVEARSVQEGLGERPVLTVGDAEAFALGGGMVGFRIDQSTVRLTINPDALRQKGLVMSSQVLRLARIVGSSS